MSATSILKLSRERYAEEVEDNLLQMVDSYFYHKYFMVGVKPERDRINHAMIFHRILCPQNCKMVNLIEKKINGQLREKTIKKQTKKENYCDFELPTVGEINW